MLARAWRAPCPVPASRPEPPTRTHGRPTPAHHAHSLASQLLPPRGPGDHPAASLDGLLASVFAVPRYNEELTTTLVHTRTCADVLHDILWKGGCVSGHRKLRLGHKQTVLEQFLYVCIPVWQHQHPSC